MRVAGRRPRSRIAALTIRGAAILIDGLDRGSETTWPLRTLAVAKRARRGRPAGSEPVQWPGLPRDETRTFTLTGPQPPKRTPVTPKDADSYPDGCFW